MSPMRAATEIPEETDPGPIPSLSPNPPPSRLPRSRRTRDLEKMRTDLAEEIRLEKELGPDPDLPPEPTEVAEATGPATPTRTRSRSTSPRPSRPRRPRPDAADVFAGADASSDRTRATFDALAEAGRAGARKKGPANEANWEEFLTVLIGFMSMLFVWWLVSGFEVAKSERDNLMVTEDEAEGMARPMARILARSWINAAYGKHVLGASDYVVLMISVAEYARRTAPYVRRKVNSVVPGRKARPEAPRRRPEDRNGNVDAAAPRPGPVGPVIFPVQAT